MEEKKEVTRTVEEITREYQQLAFKAGDLGFKVVSFQKDLDLVHAQLLKLDAEYIAARNFAAAQKDQA